MPEMNEAQQMITGSAGRGRKGWLGGLLKALAYTPAVAVPFAVFFGLQFGNTLDAYLGSYQVSLIFTVCIRVVLWVVEYFIAPRIRSRHTGAGFARFVRYTGVYVVGSMIGSFGAAIIVHFTIFPGFLGNWRAFVSNGMYTLLFTGFFGGIYSAIAFSRESAARAQKLELIRAELAQAELRALRAQLQPHFLFNTLNSIAGLIHDDPAGAESTVTRLAEVLRYTLTASDHEFSSLGEELAFVRHYLDIERVRLGSRLRVIEQIEPGIESAQVPSLLLQPLAENAVRHAIAPRPEGGVLTLKVHRIGALLELEVADDGPGMGGSTAPGGHGIGLRSIEERLRLQNPPGTLAVHTAPGAGTRICIRIPFMGDEVRRS